MKQYSFLMESINNSNIDLIKKNFKYCINTYKQVYNFDLSYMKLKISSQPVYNNGKQCHELKQEESGGCWTKLKYIQINPNIEDVMEFYKIKDPKDVFNKIIIAHELAHEIYNNVCDKWFKRLIKVKARREAFHTVYLDHVKPNKIEEETFCEYLANSIVKKKIKMIEFPKNEIEELSKKNKFITTRVSDDYDRYFEGDIVETPWNVNYKIVKRLNIDNIKKHPYYNELTERQKKFLSKYTKICVLWGERI